MTIHEPLSKNRDDVSSVRRRGESAARDGDRAILGESIEAPHQRRDAGRRRRAGVLVEGLEHLERGPAFPRENSTKDSGEEDRP